MMVVKTRTDTRRRLRRRAQTIMKYEWVESLRTGGDPKTQKVEISVMKPKRNIKGTLHLALWL